ncbi:unnamed protein product [Rotaria sp. Silwood2]|nr:unnamed protein product [Rotaria sp. Silwood2]CAF4272207.1 unnamed protein product [Rotaria sp. Silwood2]
MSKKLNKDKLSIASGSDHNRASVSISPIPLNQEILPLTGIEQETFIQQALSDIKTEEELKAEKPIHELQDGEPFRSRGLVLEGFPSTEDKTVNMIDNQLLPNLVIQLDVESKDILPKRMEQ